MDKKFWQLNTEGEEEEIVSKNKTNKNKYGDCFHFPPIDEYGYYMCERNKYKDRRTMTGFECNACSKFKVDI